MDLGSGGGPVLSRIRVVEQAGSTNAYMLGDEVTREGDWLVALSQTQGRGRQGRQWVMLSGNFAGSTVVEPRADDPAPQSLSLVAGLATIDALHIAAPDRTPLLKWPNDVMLDGDKLAGILLERAGQRIAVGIGVNLAAAPTVEGRTTTSLGGTVDPRAFAPLLAGSFARLLAQWRSEPFERLADRWLAHAHAVGTMLKVHLDPATLVSGRFEGLGPDGALLLRTEGGAIETIRAGDVEL